MEGAFEAMGDGTVDVNWAKQHHSLWLEEEAKGQRAPPKACARTPARRNTPGAITRDARDARRSRPGVLLWTRTACYSAPCASSASPAGAAPARPRSSPSSFRASIARGLKVSTLKHAHHGFDVDQPGKDSFTHRAAGATEVLVARRTAGRCCTNCARRRSRDLRALLAKMSPVDLVLVEGFKRDAVSQARSLSRRQRQAAASSRRPAYRRDRLRRAAAAGASSGGRSRRHRGDRRPPAQACACRSTPSPAACGSAVMAQLTDDCFAFSGPLLPVDEMERLIRRARHAGRRDRDVCRCMRARGRVLAARCDRADRSAAVRQFGRRRLCGAPRRSRRRRRHHGSPVVGPRHRRPRRARSRSQRGRGDPHLHRRADAGGRRHRLHAGGRARPTASSVIVPPGLKLGANRRLAGEDVRAGSVVLPAGRRLAAQHVALAAARRADRARRCAGGSRSRCSRPATKSSSRARPRRRCDLFDANRYLLAGLLRAARRGRHRSRHSAPTIRSGSRARSRQAARRTRSRAHLRRRFDRRGRSCARTRSRRIGRLVFWRVAIKPGRPVAMGVIPGASRSASAAFVGLPGNPVAVFVTFVRVVRPLLLRLAGAEAVPLRAAAGARRIRLRKKKGRREYVRVALRRSADGDDRGGQARAGRRRHSSRR